MIDPSSITGPATAFAAGLLTSVHCVGMCGPLAIVMAPKPMSGESIYPVLSIYHAARVLAYGVVGALLGFLGQAGLDAFNASTVRFLPWAMVGLFLLMALRADRWLPKSRWISKQTYRLSARARKLPKMAAGGTIGLLTPLLPCGPLYMLFGFALVMGSPIQGAEFLLAFGLGTLPLLFLAQSQYGRLQRWLSPAWMDRVQRGLALAMALLLAWRLFANLHGAGPQVECPLC